MEFMAIVKSAPAGSRGLCLPAVTADAAGRGQDQVENSAIWRLRAVDNLGTRVVEADLRVDAAQFAGFNQRSDDSPAFIAAAPAAKDEQMFRVRIALQRLLDDQRQSVEPFAHVGVAHRQPSPDAGWNRDYRRDGAVAPTSASSKAGVDAWPSRPLLILRGSASSIVAIVADGHDRRVG
jgi:hypothetical protein